MKCSEGFPEKASGLCFASSNEERLEHLCVKKQKKTRSCFDDAACKGFLFVSRLKPGWSRCLVLLQGHQLVTSQHHQAEKPACSFVCVNCWDFRLGLVGNVAPCLNWTVWSERRWCPWSCPDIRISYHDREALPPPHSDAILLVQFVTPLPFHRYPPPFTLLPLKQILRQNWHLRQTRSNLETIQAGKWPSKRSCRTEKHTARSQSVL